MPEVYHIIAKKDYAVALLEQLRQDDAIEDIESQEFELSEEQKQAIDEELELIAANPNYLQEWDDVKGRFKKP